jgi:hypothetical protein
VVLTAVKRNLQVTLLILGATTKPIARLYDRVPQAVPLPTVRILLRLLPLLQTLLRIRTDILMLQQILPVPLAFLHVGSTTMQATTFAMLLLTVAVAVLPLLHTGLLLQGCL